MYSEDISRNIQIPHTCEIAGMHVHSLIDVTETEADLLQQLQKENPDEDVLDLLQKVRKILGTTQNK